MSAVQIRRYRGELDREVWNAFVAGSRNGTFLFDRGYMDYHSDRFADHSFVFEEKGRVVALLPAHAKGESIVSHGGLTYGGFVIGSRMTMTLLEECFSLLLASMRDDGFERLVYKTIPHIYHRQPAEEDRYVLQRLGAVCSRRDVLIAIDQEERGDVQERRSRSRKKAARAGLLAVRSRDFAGYWQILTENLQSKYGVAPVHSADEMTMLAERFPDDIQLTVCLDGERMLAGVVVYRSPRVAHLQYIGASDEGRERGALDVVMEHLIEEHRDRRYFDFGAVTEQDGRYLNAGLTEFKEGFGARTIVHDFYTLEIAGKAT